MFNRGVLLIVLWFRADRAEKRDEVVGVDIFERRSRVWFHLMNFGIL